MIRENPALLRYLSELHLANGPVTASDFPPKTEIIGQEKNVKAAFIITSGIAKCYLRENNGRIFVQEFFGPGELFGEVELIRQSLSFSCIEGITQLSAFRIGQDDFHTLLHADSRFNTLILQSLANKVRYKALRHAHNQSHPAADNLVRLQQTFPDLFHTIPKQDLADYLGITLRSLNRILRGTDQ
ncbi:Crp/Fnr family transcriptional regulator [Marinoscillum sp.]|uniref:Crp/Fnr family transcriptional regulator n=1 Tax=Marinoscillum sp. TaxID=2024838 RepID=UPI003BACE2F2